MRFVHTTCCLLLACFVAACGPGNAKVDAAALTPAFSGASAEIQGHISAIVSEVSSNDYESALAPLKAVIKSKLTPEQTTALTTVLADMQRVVAENQDDFSMEVYNGLSDLVGTLAGNPPINM